MRYIRAEEVLPTKLLKAIQEYIDGATLYIPKKNPAKSTWGSVNGTKEYYAERNRLIYEAYISGSSITELAEKNCLSEKSIQRIIKRCPMPCFPYKKAKQKL